MDDPGEDPLTRETTVPSDSERFFNGTHTEITRCLGYAAVVGLIVGAFAVPAMAVEMTAREIMQQVKDRDDGDNRVSDMEMVLIDRRGKERLRKMRTFSKDKGEDDHSLMFFLSPA